jgi:17beta-estradiol 17-dehydrogenase / very-long-chain 3-oxoacyl-CoA reductase
MKARKKGVIINLSSVAAVYPLPNYALYGATKAMIDFFSAALERECRPHGIFVQVSLHLFTATSYVLIFILSSVYFLAPY